jgi:hypothetical protein
MEPVLQRVNVPAKVELQVVTVLQGELKNNNLISQATHKKA